MTSLITSGRLQNAIKYTILHKSDASKGSGQPKSQISRPLFNPDSPNLVYNDTRYDVTDYFRLAVIELKKTIENAASDDFAAVYLVNRLSWNHKILQAHACRPVPHVHRI